MSAETQARPADIDRDLGLGSRVTDQSGTRFLNRDGSFNVARYGLSFFRSLSAYHALLTMSWTRFFATMAAAYFAVNLAFASAYLLCGPHALSGGDTLGLESRFLVAFFFSVDTLATIGYGNISPRGLAANTLVTLEAFVGLMAVALATGLLFSRFARPQAQVLFSRHAVVAPYRDRTALMFRILNERRNQLIEVQATVSLSRIEVVDGARKRRFYELPLERKRVVFFPLHWVIVHPVDEKSPLWNQSQADFEASDPELLILLTAIDETFSQTVHARSSYKHDEIVWDARFQDMFVSAADGRVAVDVRRLHDIERGVLERTSRGELREGKSSP